MMTVMRNSNISLRTWWVLALSLFTWDNALAQQDPEPAKVYSNTELEELVGPVALYPDDLLAIILPASTYPLQLVQAKRYLEDHEQDPNLEPNDDWDDAVVALLNYPEIMDFMNGDLDWTWTLGEAVVNQQPEIMDAIQNFRERAYAAGNLKSDDRQIVSRVDGVIKIERAEPEVIYVPYYEPERVVVYQSVPAYYYHPFARPVYYYPYPAHYRFASGFFWGVTTAYVVGWLTDGLYAHHYGHFRHPYYGHTYRLQHFSRHHVYSHRDRSIYGGNYTRHGRVWQPGIRHGARPRHIDTPGIHAPSHARRKVTSNFSNPRLRRQTSVQRNSEFRAHEKRTTNRHTTRLSRDRVVARTDRRPAGRTAASARSNTRVGRVHRPENRSTLQLRKQSRNTSRNVSQRDNRGRRTSGTPVNRHVVANTQKPVQRSHSPQSQRTSAPERTGKARQSGGVKSAPDARRSSRSQSGRSQSGRSDGGSISRGSGGGNKSRAKGRSGRSRRG